MGVESPAYCPANINPAYLQLLRFARISTSHEPELTVDDRAATLEALNSLPNFNVYTRTFQPLLYHNALGTGLYKELEPPAREFLKQNTLRLVGAEMSNRAWLREALALFSDSGIGVILLKGAAFANHLYSAAAPRVGVDLDFLVRECDFDRCCDLLNESMTPVLMAGNRQATHDTLFERMFTPKDRPAPYVEVHRGLTNPHIFSIDEDDLWNASRTHPEYSSEPVRMLSPEDSLLHLATHAFRDLDFCSHNLLDAHEIISQLDVDWDRLRQSALDWGASRVVYLLLQNARTLMGTPVEADLLKALSPGSFSGPIMKKILQAPAPQDFSKSFSYRLKQLLAQLVFPDRVSSALRFQAHYAATRFRDLLRGFRHSPE